MTGEAGIRDSQDFRPTASPEPGSSPACRCLPDFIHLSRKLALLDAANRAKAARACSDIVRWSDSPESGHFREQKAFFHALILRNMSLLYNLLIEALIFLNGNNCLCVLKTSGIKIGRRF